MSALKSGEIIGEILENLRAGAEELYEKIVVPEVYLVYLHPHDFEQINLKSVQIIAEAKKALSDEINRKNQAIDIFEQGLIGRSLAKLAEIYNYLSSFLRGKPSRHRHLKKKYAEPLQDWQISLNPALENECSEGEIIIKSIAQVKQLTGLKEPKTLRIVTLKVANQRFVTREKVDEIETVKFDLSLVTVESIFSLSAESKPLAFIHLKKNSGQTSYKMTKSPFTVGRGGANCWIDLPIMNNSKISQEHLRINRDEKTGKFFIKDLSRNGTNLNGKALPVSLGKSLGKAREIDLQTELPNHSTILLAGEITLEFELAN